MARLRKQKPIERSIHTLDLRESLSHETSTDDDVFSTYSVDPQAQRDLERYMRLQSQPVVVRAIKKVFHIIGWGVRLVLPAFLVGHPSLFDNLKTLWKNPTFRPLRMLGLAWLTTSVVIASAAGYFLLKAPHSSAASTPKFQTGYYFGSGAAKSITGLGFTPQVVIVKSDNAGGGAILKTSSMPAGEYAYWGVATADNTENQITLDSDGFTVQINADVNAATIRYSWIAFAGSDCTSAGSICVGSYTGNGSASQIISTGFQPSMVWTKRAGAFAGMFRTSAMATNNSSSLIAAIDDTSGIIQTLDATSFTVGTTNNTNGGLYYFVAFKNSSDVRLAVGTYTGDGTSSKTISGLGFRPNFALTKPNAATAPAFNITQTWGDYSHLTTVAVNTTGAIKLLNSDGFVVGSAANSNTNGTAYQYFAFGNAPAFAPTESFTMRRGSYTGSGVARTISGIGFAPDLVLIKSDGSTDYAVWSTSLDYNLTHYLASATAGFTGGITAMTSDGFSLGTRSTVNTNSIVYQYVAFGNATTPEKGAHAADFFVGMYTGNGIDSRAIDNLGIAPDMVVIKSNATNLGIWATSTAVNCVAYFSATADDCTGAFINTHDSGGFTIGTNAVVNTAAAIYNFFGFKKGTGKFNLGMYTGTGVGRNITGLGFDPDFLWIKATTSASRAVHRSTDSGITGTNSQVFTNVANIANAITAFVTDGFTIGTAVEVNTTNNNYRWAAWKAPTPTAAPNTPTNSAPANAATAVDLNPTLTSAAYSDSGGNSQTDAQWQVDDNSDFSAPEWTRTAGTAEASTVVNASNGTFANNLSGDTELAHNTVYYFRVKHSNGLWSSWSTGTSFTTNTIATPTNSSPSDGATVQTLTPSLTASAFSDAQGGHTGTSAEWIVDRTSSFSSSYDSGEVAYSTSFAVPSAILSNQTTYYWKVRYKDSGGQWSSYSTPTRFLVAQTPVVVKPLFSNTIVDQGDSINIDAQVKLSDETVVNSADSVTISIYNPAGTKIVTDAAMSHVSGSNGIYRYSSYTVPSTNGSYLYEITATENSVSGYAAGNFQVKTLAADISTLNSTASTISSNVNTVSTNVNTANTTLGTVNTNVNTANTILGTINTNVNTANSTLSTISSTLSSVQTSVANLISEIGTGNIAAIKTKTDTISWSDVTGIVATSSEIKAKTNTIAWGDITGIKTKTDSISWSDVTGIKLKTDTIVWGDITTVKADVATLLNEIGTGNIAAIKTKTDSIVWSNITGLVTTAGDIKLRTDTIDWGDITAIKTKTTTIDWTDVTGIKTKTDTINWSDVTDTKTAVESAQASLDMLVGAFIVTQASVDDTTASPTLFLTSLVNTTNNFYKNSVLTFTTGDLKGQSRRVVAYTGSTKAIRLDPALTSAPADGDQFTIVAQNVHVEELATDIATTTTLIASTTADTNTKVTDIQAKVNQIKTKLDTVDSKLDTLQASIDALRTSQQSAYTVTLEGTPTIESGKTYRAKLAIEDYESKPADAASGPTITVYDSERVAVATNAAMTKTGTGVYEYTYTVASGATAGLWESVVTVPIGNTSQTKTNYWTVSGAPAQVLINSMESLTVPTISANVTITNEGNSAYEYQYQWCVVSNQTDACTSPSVVAVASAAKLIQPGQDFNTILSLTVPNPGNYWFKLSATFNGQTSAASRSFTAISGITGNNTTGTGGGGSYNSSDQSNMTAIRNQLEVNAVQMNKLLAVLGNVDPSAQGFRSLLTINQENASSIKDIQNKMADLKAVSAALHQIADQKNNEPVVQTYMKFNSVELYFLITNPDSVAKTVHFKSALPEEVKPGSILNSDGLKVEYDPTTKVYNVSGDIALDAGQSVTRKIEMKDIWTFPRTDLDDVLSQAASISKALVGTQYAAQVTLLENDLKSKVSDIITSQDQSYNAPENHIVTYRQNKEIFDQAKEDLANMKEILGQSGASQGLLGKIGGIQTFATWGIILAMVFGFALMAAIIFAMWRNQMALTAMAMKMDRGQIQSSFMPRSKRTIRNV